MENLQSKPTGQTMTTEHFKSIRSTMNSEQLRLLDTITRSIEEQKHGSPKRIRTIVVGNAGVGKTFTLVALKEQVNLAYGRETAKIGASTGLAANVVGGQTLHTLFSLPVIKWCNGGWTPFVPLNDFELPLMQEKWKDIEFLFIDNISVVSHEMLCRINSRLKQLKNEPNETFGGINVMLFGDFDQLNPIEGNPVYKGDQFNFWELFKRVEMRENIRQKEDPEFLNFLNALRTKKLSFDHFKIMMSKVLVRPSEDLETIRIYPLGLQVDEHNANVIKKYRAQGAEIYEIEAEDKILDSDENTLLPDETDYLPKKLEIFIGARVMLRSNISIEQGLVNGAMGNIIDLTWNDSDIPYVAIEFDRIGSHIIYPKTALHDYGRVDRKQLPLLLCYACTVHKIQGSTLDRAVVYIGPKLFGNGPAYVALSRVKSFRSLKIELEPSDLMMFGEEEAFSKMKTILFGWRF